MNENLILLITNIFVFVFGGGLLLILPQITRKSLLFGVKIPMEEAGSEHAAALRKRYIRTCVAGVLIILAICITQYLLMPDRTLLTTLYMPLLLLPLYLLAFVPNWKEAVRLKQQKGWQVSGTVFAETATSHTRGNLSKLPWLWYVVTLVIVVATIVVAIVRYPALPDQVPGHIGPDMQATRYVDKTWGAVLLMPLTNLVSLALMFVVSIMIEKAKLQIDATKPRVSFLQHVVYRRRMGNAIGFFALGMGIALAISGIPFVYTMPPGVGTVAFGIAMVFAFAPMAVLVGVILKTGQGGCKIKVDENAADAENPVATGPAFTGRGDDKYWILGMFYCNPDDPAYIVEGRFGPNMGPNYGRLPVKIGMGLLVLALVVMYVWLTVLLV